MKYYKVVIKSFYGDRIASSANGENVPNGRCYFDRIGKGEILYSTPIFDYFYLKSFDKKEYWEWQLNDVHDFIGVGSIIVGWCISDNFKQLLESFKIAPRYHFYETRLLYKGEKLKYWIFQFPIKPLKNIIFKNSGFYFFENDKKIQINIESDDIFMKIRRKLLLDDDIELQCDKVCFKEQFDIVYNLPCGDILCSENLKNAIEVENLKGFEFSELDYEVVVDKN